MELKQSTKTEPGILLISINRTFMELKRDKILMRVLITCINRTFMELKHG